MFGLRGNIGRSRVLAGACGIALLAACSSGASDTGDAASVKVGAHWCLTGVAAYAGAQLQRGTELAVTEINEGNYLGETQIELVTEDDENLPAAAVTAAQRLVETHQVAAIVGGCSSAPTLAAVEVAQEAGVPWVIANAVAPGITEVGDYIFRTSQPYTPFIENTVNQVVESLTTETAAIVYGADNPTLEKGASDYRAFFEAKGVDIVAYEGIPDETTDFSSVITKIARLNPQPDALAILLLGPPAANFALQSRNRGIESRLLGHMGTNTPDMYEIGEEAVVGMIMPANWFTTVKNSLNDKFVANYQEEYGEDPDLFAANGYAGAWVLASAIKEAKSGDRDAIRNALESIDQVETIYGPMTFTQREGEAPGVNLEIGPEGVFRVWEGE